MKKTALKLAQMGALKKESQEEQSENDSSDEEIPDYVEISVNTNS